MTDIPTDDNAEPDDAGADHGVPTDLRQLHEIMEWDDALQGKAPNQ